MSNNQRIEFLEKQVRHLSAEKHAALKAIELAASLGGFGTSLNKLSDPVPILQETSVKLHSLIKIKAFCFYIVNEENSNFEPAFYQPAEHFQFINDEVERLIEENTFAWCLGRNKPHVTTSKARKETLIIQTLATLSRIRGIFVGVLGQERFSISDSTMCLFTLLLHACAQTLESYELYAWNRRTVSDMQAELKQHEKLKDSMNRKLVITTNQLQSTQLELVQLTEELNKGFARQQELEKSMRQLIKQDKILYKLSQQLSESTSLDSNAHFATRAAATLTGSVDGFACWFASESQRIRLPELNKTTIRHFSLHNFKELHKEALPGVWGKTLLSGKSFYSNEPVDVFPLQQGVKKTLGPKRILSVPVLDSSSENLILIGQITLSNAPKSYGPADVLTVERIASLFVLSLKRFLFGAENI